MYLVCDQSGTCCCPLFTVTAADVSGNSLTISANMTEPGTPSPACIPPEPKALPPGALISNATANFTTSTLELTTAVYSTDATTAVPYSSKSSTETDYATSHSTTVFNLSDATTM
ncbi:uncharacterized protein LOC117113338, partial [Anneissia japonica]|uniref:uncharacterized protein LOC117113338 n=1 Tax=Anneissia japonica TaxID=1529436 RepID=UPI001425B5F2